MSRAIERERSHLEDYSGQSERMNSDKEVERDVNDVLNGLGVEDTRELTQVGQGSKDGQPWFIQAQHVYSHTHTNPKSVMTVHVCMAFRHGWQSCATISLSLLLSVHPNIHFNPNSSRLYSPPSPPLFLAVRRMMFFTYAMGHGRLSDFGIRNHFSISFQTTLDNQYARPVILTTLLNIRCIAPCLVD